MSKLRVPVNGLDHMRGSLRAPVSLVEYGDYECPHCAAAQPIVDKVWQVFADSLCYVFRHFPLATVHPHAQHAAEAAEAAADQGAFWPMHELLFEQQEALDDGSLLEYAEELGLDVRRFGHELLTQVHAPRVRRDFMGGVRSGVNGTPTFFVNGVRHDGAYDFVSLTSAVRLAMAERVRAGT
jgi:protein-disulfide isomerase